MNSVNYINRIRGYMPPKYCCPHCGLCGETSKTHSSATCTTCGCRFCGDCGKELHRNRRGKVEYAHYCKNDNYEAVDIQQQ